MSKIKTILLSLSVAFLVIMQSLPVMAEEDYFSRDYTYMVRIFSGNQGTFVDGSTQMVFRISPGTTIDLRNILAGVVMNPSKDAMGNEIENKYYAKGIRESGKDNNTVNTLLGPVFHVNRDIDLVVAYAMAGGDVAYTIQYLSETGEELMPSQTLYGNVGEKPVVAYQYIDGYVPQAYNLAKTLSEDESLNVFTFTYKKGSTAGYYYTETDGGIKYVDVEGETTVEFIPGTIVYIESGAGGVTVYPGGNNTVTTNQNGNAQNNGNPANGGAFVADGNDQGDNTGENPEGQQDNLQPDNNQPENDGPQELIDLDEEEVPLADGINPGGFYKDGAGKAVNSMSTASKVIFGVLLVAVVGCIATACVMIAQKKKSLATSQEASETDEEE